MRLRGVLGVCFVVEEARPDPEAGLAILSPGLAGLASWSGREGKKEFS